MKTISRLQLSQKLGYKKPTLIYLKPNSNTTRLRLQSTFCTFQYLVLSLVSFVHNMIRIDHFWTHDTRPLL